MVEAHLRRASFVLMEVEVNDVAHLVAASVYHPVMPIKGHLSPHPAVHARQRAVPHNVLSARAWVEGEQRDWLATLSSYA